MGSLAQALLMINPLGSQAWVSSITGIANGNAAQAASINGTAVFSVGNSNLNRPTSGNNQITSFNSTDGSINFQETVNRVTCQYVLGAIFDSNGKIRFASIEFTGGTGTETVASIMLNADGTLNNETRITTAGRLLADQICADVLGNIYIITENGGGITSIFKFDSSNNLVASRNLTGAYGQNSIEISGTNLIVSGVWSNGGDYSPYYASITDDLLTVNWARHHSNIISVSSDRSIAVDSSGNSYYLKIPSGPLTLVKYDSSGVLQWQKSISATSPGPSALLATPAGIVVTLYDSSTLLGHVFLFDSSGNVIWKTSFANTGGQVYFGNRLATDGTFIYLPGAVNSLSNFVMKLPLASAIVNGTFGSWTVATSTVTTGAGGLVGEAAHTLSTASRTDTTAAAAPTVAASALTFSNQVL